MTRGFPRGLPDDLPVVFANTGLEEPETYEFLEAIHDTWGVEIVWLEYERRAGAPAVARRGKQFVIGCHGYRVVTPKTADRAGRPFRELLLAKQEFRKTVKQLPAVLPNPAQRFCSGELKARTMERYFLDRFGDVRYTAVVGIRADEANRARNMEHNSATLDRRFAFPLVDAGTTEEDVLAFWKHQPFDLKLPHDPAMGTYLGNCGGCFLKRKAKLDRIARERPESIRRFADLEEEFGQTFRNDRPAYGKILAGALGVCDTDEDDEEACACTD